MSIYIVNCNLGVPKLYSFNVVAGDGKAKNYSIGRLLNAG